jgi:hypothetical protein
MLLDDIDYDQDEWELAESAAKQIKDKIYDYYIENVIGPSKSKFVKVEVLVPMTRNINMEFKINVPKEMMDEGNEQLLEFFRKNIYPEMGYNDYIVEKYNDLLNWSINESSGEYITGELIDDIPAKYNEWVWGSAEKGKPGKGKGNGDIVRIAKTATIMVTEQKRTNKRGEDKEYQIKPGTKIINIRITAGYGKVKRKNDLTDNYDLEDTKKNKNNWRKFAGYCKIIDLKSDTKYICELHWCENDLVGAVERRVKGKVRLKPKEKKNE